MRNLLSVKDLSLRFINEAIERNAINGISFDIGRGEIVGLVGESGSGKSVTAMSICGLTSHKRADIFGSIVFEGEDVL
ncbi:MAG: ATP-binding cassette domain-containing protein, partial [Oscillospiraceae bacterium]|nr:ATP-binding cassette domain-containing protein [Oscillospiraceae bacterium]